jgi:hypothetical protein
MTTKLSDIDQALIRYADTLSPNAISMKIGGLLTPEQVAARIAVLLDTPDRLTQLQQDQLVTLKMRQIVTNLDELTLTTRNAEVMLNGLEKIGARLDRRVESTQKELSTLYAFQGNVLLDAVQIAMAHMRGALTHGNKLAEEEWDNALESAIRFAQIELSTHEEIAPDDGFQKPLTIEAKVSNPAKMRTLPVPELPVRKTKKADS